jgi:electron transfer flavoprotein beta subunit
VSRLTVDAGAGTAVASKEYAGGVMGRFEVTLPAFIGIQGCEKPPRYVPIAKVRAAMSAGDIETVAAASGPSTASLELAAMAKPTEAGHAEMLEGSVPDVAERVADILADRGLL